MQLAGFPKDQFEILKGGEGLIVYAKNPDSGTVRYSCPKCGSFCYKDLGPDTRVVPLGALSGDTPIKPTMHIFVGDKGNQDIMFPELPQHKGFP
jgi:hypothetical protein